MQYNVTDYLKDRRFGVTSTDNGLFVTDQSGKSQQLDTSAFTKKDDGFYADIPTLRTSLNKSNIGAPKGYVPLRNTLSAAGANVGYDAEKDAPIVNGHLLNTDDKRLVKVGDSYYMDRAFAEDFMPKTYKNPYQSQTDSLLSSLINSQFSYDPNEDEALRVAQENAMLRAKQAANSRGLLGGTTAEIMRQRAAQDLIPQYQSLAYSRYQDDRDTKLRTLSLLDSLADNAFSEYKTEADIRQTDQSLAQNAEDSAAKQAATLFNQQLEKVSLMGEVDEEAAKILHLPVGTLTEDRRQFLESFSQVLQKLAQEANYQSMRDEKLFQNELARDAQNHTYDLAEISAKK